MFKKVLWQLSKNFSTKIGIVGVPFEEGQGKIGVANGPEAIRKANLIENIKSIHQEIDIHDYGDVSYTSLENVEVPNMKKYSDVAACNFQVSRSVEKILNDGRICLTLGGDHSIGIGTVDGHIKAKNEKVCILWVDAHADLNTNKTSVSGNIHGMPLAILVKELADYWPYLPGMDWQKPILPIRNVAYIGLRSVDSYERLIIEQFGITAYGMEDVENYGIHNIVNMALDRIDPHRMLSIHLSFDIDSLDSLEAPSTGTSVRGGLTLREGIHLVEQIYKTSRLGAMDLVEVNPSIGSPKDVQKTVEAAVHLLMAACGYTRRGLIPRGPDGSPIRTIPSPV
ncbi:arginase-1 [Tribolium madens]|uniref:arginase-1 n=1 Tax=Tribolium madens TaxID=41895 RepID=UPI001CF7223C|nr:arginase-1 [Tribolium madens]